MSKQAAMSMLTGEAKPQVNPSILTPDLPANNSPGLQAVPDAPATEEVKPSGIDSDRFAKLAAREARLQKEREQFKNEQQKIYEEKERLKSVQAKINEYEAMKANDPIAALKYLGFTEADLFNYMAEKPELTPEQKAAEAAAKAADEKIKGWEQQQAEKASKELQERDAHNIKQYKDLIGQSISKEAEKYEYCAHYGPVAEEIVYETILGFMKEDPELSPHQAMKEAIEAVEKFYEDEDKAMSSLKKRKPVQIEEPLKPEVSPKPSPQRVRTLQTQAPVKSAPTTTGKATTSVSNLKKETPAEKRARLENWLRNGKP